MIINVVKIISSSIESGKRILKFLRLGKNDVQTSYESMPFGIDSSPIKNMKAIYCKTGVKGETIIIGYINTNQIVNEGETKIYSTDSNGNIQTYIYLKNDGDINFGGNSDNLVRYSTLKSEYDKTKETLDAILTILNGTPIPEPGNGAPSALQTALKTALTGKNTGDISGCKIDQFKTL